MKLITRAFGTAAALAVVLFTASCDLPLGVGDPFGSAYIEIAWPENDARLYGTEVFRARLRDGRRLDDYEMYWYVDDGRDERMYDNWQDRTPHKFDEVDVYRWDWRGRGPYTVTFVAEDYSGRVIGERSVRVYVD